MNATLEKLSQFGIVPVVVLDDAKDAAPLAKALCDGGLACAEVTFRTAAAENPSASWQQNILRWLSEPEQFLQQSRLTVQ